MNIDKILYISYISSIKEKCSKKFTYIYGQKGLFNRIGII